MPEASTRDAVAPTQPVTGPRRFTLRQRIVLRIIITLGYWVIRLIGPTLRVSISYEDGGGSGYPGFTPSDAGTHSRDNEALYVDFAAKPIDRSSWLWARVRICSQAERVSPALCIPCRLPS